MTATKAPALSRPFGGVRRPGLAAARLLRIELRHNAMLWMLPVAIGLFWFTAYRKTMAMAPLWNLRAANLQFGAILAFATPVAGAAAWMGSREARRRTTDLVTITAWPRCARLAATWAATTCWALVGYLGCVAVTYGMIARHASWGGPLWWPVAVAAAALATMSALGFAVGVLLPSRFTAPLAAVAAFFVLALSTQLIVGGQSYWQISPIVTGPWETGPDAGVATFYPYLPDLSIAQVMFLAGLTVAVLGALVLPKGSGGRGLRAAAAVATVAGLLAAGTAVRLAATGKLSASGMITIPALHDAANDRPLAYTPVCSQTAIRVCLNPAYASYLPAVTAALQPVLREVVGLPGAPTRISQAAATYRQGEGNGVSISLSAPPSKAGSLVVRMLLPDQLDGPALTTSELAAQARSSTGPVIIASVVGDAPSASQAQHAVWAALTMAAGLPLEGSPSAASSEPAPSRPKHCKPPSAGCPAPTKGSAAGTGTQPPEVAKGSPAYAAARRFAALSASARHAWLVQHLTALRAGQITLAQLP